MFPHPMRMKPQQVSPAVGFICARQKMHARACQPILMGCMREPGSLMHPQVTPIERMKLTHISHWGAAPGPLLLSFFAA